MHFQATTLLAVVASLAVFVHAQDLSGVPECAIPCFVAALPDSNCGVTDTECQCTTGRDAITNSLLECAPRRCEAGKLVSLVPAVSSLCAAVGVTISDVPTSLPSSIASTTGSASDASATSEISGTGTATGAEATPTNAAAGKAVGYGAVALGMAAVFGL
ncbi:hypothetical protein BDW02DRAFT_566493 [Decorospora gaudefroyi]|uniref:CFEM domain-containing protein n=1 Tax=Decorospora gaudefroyi TaxID=184978 RepID=A0A6A5KMU2_9PLEO|nr:hypothetical protein BDW02DRAFT_566493 [Decorospora gaudefroyi]